MKLLEFLSKRRHNSVDTFGIALSSIFLSKGLYFTGIIIILICSLVSVFIEEVISHP